MKVQTLAAFAAATMLGGLAATQLAPPAQAQQAAFGAPLAVAATTVGATSHAWIVDAGTRTVTHCRADNATTRVCEAMPLPGPSLRR